MRLLDRLRRGQESNLQGPSKAHVFSRHAQSPFCLPTARVPRPITSARSEPTYRTDSALCPSDTDHTDRRSYTNRGCIRCYTSYTERLLCRAWNRYHATGLLLARRSCSSFHTACIWFQLRPYGLSGTRTHGLPPAKRVFYQLNYQPKPNTMLLDCPTLGADECRASSAIVCMLCLYITSRAVSLFHLSSRWESNPRTLAPKASVHRQRGLRDFVSYCM